MLTVVTGSPGSGKTTYVQERKQRLDIVLDFDSLAYALGSNVDHHAVPHHPVHIAAARVAWVAVWKELMKWRAEFPGDVWIIHSSPQQWQIERYRERGAARVHLPEQERKVNHDVDAE